MMQQRKRSELEKRWLSEGQHEWKLVVQKPGSDTETYYRWGYTLGAAYSQLLCDCSEIADDTTSVVISVVNENVGGIEVDVDT